MNILLLSTGGGGGNILRSLKTMIRRDLVVTQASDPKYAERLRRAVATRFLDTNEFSLTDVPKDERLLIGAATTQRLGSRHNPEVARTALEESKGEVASLFNRFSVIVLIGTGGKGTGAGTLFPLAQMARAQKKLVIPIFVRPSFERHEVDKRRYDHALSVTEQFDAAKIRLLEILNDRGYVETDPQPQSVVWDRMNRPIARGLRGLLYVLSDLSQVDPSDLSVMFAGQGRLRIGFAEIDPPGSGDPTDDQVQEAVRACWDNPYYAFDNRVGTSLICLEGDWSNVVDGKIKGRIGVLAHGDSGNAPYNPLYVRAFHVPRPWGVTALFSEFTGTHSPLEIDWGLARRPPAIVGPPPAVGSVAVAADNPTVREVGPHPPTVSPPVPPAEPILTAPTCPFASFWEFAVALNRADRAALALATDGLDCPMAIDGGEIRKLLSTMWFRSVFPHLSRDWRDRVLDVLLQSVAIPNHALRHGRRTVHVSELAYDELKQIMKDTIFTDAIRSDLQLLIAVGTLWGKDTLPRFRFVETPEPRESSRLGSLLEPLRHWSEH